MTLITPDRSLEWLATSAAAYVVRATNTASGSPMKTIKEPGEIATVLLPPNKLSNVVVPSGA